MNPEPIEPQRAAGAAADQRYRAFGELSRFPLGDDRELVYTPFTRAARVLPSYGVRLIQGCRAFATLDEHARRLGREFNLAPGQEEPLRRDLGVLAEAGFLVSHDALAETCAHTATAPSSPARITAVGIPTRDRTESLRRCVDDYVESSRRHGRTGEVVVVDDSRTVEALQANRHMLRSLRTRHGPTLAYAGPDERRRFVEALRRHGDFPPDVVRFGLLNDGSFPIATGSARNALLLHTAGEALLQVDDDSTSGAAPIPDARPGLALSSMFDPTEFWFLTEGEPGLPAETPPEHDVLALHESWLGIDPGQALAAADSPADVHFDQAGAGFFQKLEAGRVLVTAAGWAGDSGMSSSVYLVSLEGPSRARLLSSEGGYRFAMTRHQVIRGVTQTTLSDGGLCVGINLGLDNRDLLPPFLPIQRNSDGVFGALVRACCDGYFGFLPWMVPHHAPVPRQFPAADLTKHAGQVQTGQIVQALVRAFLPGPVAGGAAKLRALGRSLVDWGSAPRADFEEMVRLLLWNQMSRLAAQWEDQLRRYQGQPAYWAQDVRQLLATVRQALPSPSYGCPADLAAAFGPDQAGEVFQGVVRRFGELLQIWPDLVAAAKELRQRGVRLATAP